MAEGIHLSGTARGTAQQASEYRQHWERVNRISVAPSMSASKL
jgi:hypothetical protein